MHFYCLVQKSASMIVLKNNATCRPWKVISEVMIVNEVTMQAAHTETMSDGSRKSMRRVESNARREETSLRWIG